jgi:hypothetical protein
MTFPRLFSLSNQKEGSVLDIAVVGGDSLEWNFSWRRNLFQWEEVLVVELKELLEEVELSSEEDCWK